MLSPLAFGREFLPANTLNGELTRHGSTVKSCQSLSIPAPRPVGRMVSGIQDVTSCRASLTCYFFYETAFCN